MITGVPSLAGANLQYVYQNADTDGWIPTITVELDRCGIIIFKLTKVNIKI